MGDFIPNFWRAMTEQDTGRRFPKRRRLGAIDVSFDASHPYGPSGAAVLREIEIGLSARTRLHLEVNSKFHAEAMQHARQMIANHLMGDVSMEIARVAYDLTATGDLDYGDPRIRRLLGIVAGIETGRGKMPEPEEIANAD